MPRAEVERVKPGSLHEGLKLHRSVAQALHFGEGVMNKPEYHLQVRKLYPHLSAARRAEAEHFLNQYLEVMRRILDEEKDLTTSDLNTRLRGH